MIERVLKRPEFANLTEQQKSIARIEIIYQCNWDEFKDEER
jgi:hypothetical protein